jgi:hypothetical protein
MQSAKQAYIVAGVDLASVCNRNETRVAACLRKVLEELGNPTLETKVLQDAFALALNQLPARYAQSGTIVLREPVRKEDITAAVEKSLHRALANPKP